MRVVGGKYRSRPLKSASGDRTRPTTDKVKEALFNMIGPNFDGGTCLDYYAGSGSLGIEAVSRGMDRAVLTERHGPSLQALQANVTMTKEEDRFTILKGNNASRIKQLKGTEADLVFDWVFLDPPYAQEKIVEDIMYLSSLDLIRPVKTRIVVESASGVDYPQEVEGFYQVQAKHYHTTSLYIYEGA